MASYFIPVGKFDVNKIQYTSEGHTLTKNVLVAESFTFKTADNHTNQTKPIGFFESGDDGNGFTNILYNGLTSGSHSGGAIAIIAFLLIVGGAFNILIQTKVIDNCILKTVSRFKNNQILLLPLLCFIFSLGGAVFGMGEETIPFMILLTPIFVLIGYDALSCVMVVYLATQIGFATSWMNPFSVSITQGIAELPLLSGSMFRIFMWLFFTTCLTIYAMYHSYKIYKNPKKSPMYEYDNYYRESKNHSLDVDSHINIYSWLILITLVSMIIWLVYGVVELGYYIPEIATLFFILGLVVAVIAIVGKVNDMTIEKAVSAFKNGAKDLSSICIIIGLAYGLIALMGGTNPQDYSMLNTVLHYAQSTISTSNQYIAAISMFLFQSLFNFFVSSGSGQAALTMPIMSPLADLTGVSRQIAVLAFQLGDGWTHCLVPTSAPLMAVLGVARVPYGLWVKFIFKFYLFLMFLSIFMIVLAVFIGYK